MNQTFVNQYLKDVDPLAQRVVIEQLVPGETRLGPPLEWQIVGVYGDVRNAGPRNEGFPEIDVPFAQSPWPGTVVAVRTAGERCLPAAGTANAGRQLSSAQLSSAQMSRSAPWLDHVSASVLGA